MLIPEIILYNTIKSFVQVVKNDYMNATDKTQTILNDLFNVDNNSNVLSLENFNYLEQSIALFTRTQESPREFLVSIGYNLQRAFLPCVHILLPQESPGRYDSIGLSQGEISTEYHPEATPQYEIVTRIITFRATFDLMITSDNSSEVLLIYYFVKTMFPYCVDTLEILGLHNFKFTGQDVQLDREYGPPNIFHRSLRVEFDYQSETKIRNYRQMASALNFQICSNFADDFNKQNPQPSPQQHVSDNFTINITKTTQAGAVGYIKFTNKLNGNVTNTAINLTGQSNEFQITADLVPAHYGVEINLMNFVPAVTGDIGDGENLDWYINSNGQNSFNNVYDLSKTTSNDIIINLNFN